eukprot:scaffold189_cov249-Pinguiococcus_pyrenoidosus.AAC.20
MPAQIREEAGGGSDCWLVKSQRLGRLRNRKHVQRGRRVSSQAPFETRRRSSWGNPAHLPLERGQEAEQRLRAISAADVLPQWLWVASRASFGVAVFASASLSFLPKLCWPVAKGRLGDCDFGCLRQQQGPVAKGRLGDCDFGCLRQQQGESFPRSGTRARGHAGTRALGHSGTRALGHSGTRATRNAARGIGALHERSELLGGVQNSVSTRQPLTNGACRGSCSAFLF